MGLGLGLGLVGCGLGFVGCGLGLGLVGCGLGLGLVGLWPRNIPDIRFLESDIIYLPSGTALQSIQSVGNMGYDESDTEFGIGTGTVPCMIPMQLKRMLKHIPLVRITRPNHQKWWGIVSGYHDSQMPSAR